MADTDRADAPGLSHVSAGVRSAGAGQCQIRQVWSMGTEQRSIRPVFRMSETVSVTWRIVTWKQRILYVIVQTG